MFCNFLIKMFKMEAACGFLEGKDLERGRMGRAEVATLLQVTHQQPCFARTRPKDLGDFVCSLAKVPWSSPKSM